MIHLVYQIAVPIRADMVAFQAYHVECPLDKNLMNYLYDRRIIAANVFPTRKYAEEVTALWNQQYKKNGTLFEEVEK